MRVEVDRIDTDADMVEVTPLGASDRREIATNVRSTLYGRTPDGDELTAIVFVRMDHRRDIWLDWEPGECRAFVHSGRAGLLGAVRVAVNGWQLPDLDGACRLEAAPVYAGPLAVKVGRRVRVRE